MGSSSTSTGTMLLSNPRVRSLVYWDNPRDSGIVCGSLLVCLLAVRYISLISVIGNLSLALVTATMSFRIYKSVLAAVNKNQEGHPFKAFLDVDIRIPEAQLTAAVGTPELALTDFSPRSRPPSSLRTLSSLPSLPWACTW